MRTFAVLSLLLLALSILVLAAQEQANAETIAAAVGSSMESGSSTSTTAPTAPQGFAQSRMDDIKKRVKPIGRTRTRPDSRDFGPQNGPGGFGDGFGSEPSFGGPGFGPGPDYSPGFGSDEQPGFGPQDDRFSPGSDKRSGPAGPKDFGPQPYGPPQKDFGPGPQGPQFGPGPRDFRGLGGFELPPEAIEGMIFNQIGDKLETTYGEEKLLAKCGNKQELVSLILDEFQKTGVNLQQEICSDIEEGLAFCSEAKEKCGQIGNPEFGGPRFGPEDDEKPFIPTCPPDANQWKQACIERFSRDFERNLGERKEEIELNCQERWAYDRPPDDACKDGKPRQPMECDKSEWISQCLERQQPEGDWGPGPEPYGPPQNQPHGQPPYGQPNGQQWQPNQPPQNVQCPPVDENLKQQCINNGQSWTVTSGPNGCPQIVCQGAPQQPPQQPPNYQPPNGQPSQPPQPTQPPQEQPTQSPQPTQPPQEQPTQQPQPSQPPQEPQPSIQAAAAPYSGLVTGRMSPSERCEQDWNRNAQRFAQQCQRMQEKNRGPNFNFCNEQEFMAQCKQEAQKHMEKEKQRRSPEKMCEIETKREMKHFERYCKDTQQGKERCLKESERGCEFGKKQLTRCKELTSPENIKKAVERAVLRECRVRTGLARESRYNKLNEYVTDEGIRPVMDFVSDDLTVSEEQLSEAEKKERDLLYQLFRTNKDNQQQAKKFRESVGKLDSSIKNLKAMREAVNEDKRSLFDEEIANIEKRRDEANQNANALEKGSEGILSFFAKLFGG